jgi:hypothetical protein
MSRFCFHGFLNGQTVPDRRGTALCNKKEACPRRSLHSFGSKEIGQHWEYVPCLEVSDGERTVYVVRGTVVIEKC